MEKGYEPDYKIYVSVIVLGDKAGYIYQSTLVHLQLGGGLAPLRALCGKDALRGGAPGLGRWDSRFFSPIILLRGDTNSPGLDV